MLSYLTPFILGVLIQVGSILGEKRVKFPELPPGELADAKQKFSKDLDTAQLVPSVITLATGSFLIAPDIGRNLTAIFVAVALLGGIALLTKMEKMTASEYARVNKPLKGVSVLNVVMILANVGFGLAAYVTQR